MGVIAIQTWGSFPPRREEFGAMERGHAHAVAEAIRFLADEVLPEAIERDHKLHDEGAKPEKGFDRRALHTQAATTQVDADWVRP